MKVVFTRAAEKSFVRLPIDRQRQILVRIEAVASDPHSRRLGVEPLAGGNLLRLRVGNYRVLFTTDEAQEVLTIELIRTRGDVYKR
jgi:mRNA interferase RelE/StbE